MLRPAIKTNREMSWCHWNITRATCQCLHNRFHENIYNNYRPNLNVRWYMSTLEEKRSYTLWIKSVQDIVIMYQYADSPSRTNILINQSDVNVVNVKFRLLGFYTILIHLSFPSDFRDKLWGGFRGRDRVRMPISCCKVFVGSHMDKSWSLNMNFCRVLQPNIVL